MRGRLTRGSLPVAAAAVLAVGCGSAQTRSQVATSTASSHAAPPGLKVIGGCRASQLAAGYARTDGATGHLELTIALRNVSPIACRLRGYPAAALLDGAGRRLPLRESRRSGFFPDTHAQPRPVVVAPGALAHFGIGLVTNREYAHAQVCHVAAAAMTAAPVAPARWQRVWLRRAPRITACGSSLTVSPIHA